MNILFIKSSIGSSLLPSFDMGIASMSAVLKQNKHRVSFFSFDSWEALRALEDRIKQFKPEVIGFTVTASTYASSVEISKKVKNNYQNKFIVFGGVHPTIFPECINASKSIDAICLGEGEYALLDLVNNLEKGGRKYLKTQGFWIRDKMKIVKNAVPRSLIDINALPIPDRSIFLNEGILKYPREYIHDRFCLEFIFSRGCPFNCSYCSNHALRTYHGSGFVRQKDPKEAIKEIKYVMKHYRYDYFRFHDDTFTLNKKWLDAFLKQYSKIKVPFHCNIRADVCTKETLQKMKDAGCEEILIGVESGDEELRTKVLNKNISSSVMSQAFKWASEIGLRSAAYLLIGLPEENPKRFLNTIDFMSNLPCDEIFLYVYYPYPGTRLYSECMNKGYLQRYTTDLYTREREDTILNMPDFKREDILYYFSNFDRLLKLAKNRNYRGDKIISYYNKLLYFLYSKPPSSPHFKLFYRTAKMILFVRHILNSSISLVLKVL